MAFVTMSFGERSLDVVATLFAFVLFVLLLMLVLVLLLMLLLLLTMLLLSTLFTYSSVLSNNYQSPAVKFLSLPNFQLPAGFERKIIPELGSGGGGGGGASGRVTTFCLNRPGLNPEGTPKNSFFLFPIQSHRISLL